MFAGLCDLPTGADESLEIRHVTEDSRKVKPGSLFVAVSGGQRDGHAYVEAAIRSGAVAVLGDRTPVLLTGDAGIAIPYVHADAPRRVLGVVAHALHGNPSQAMNVIGVTGTNGKTSTVRLVEHILNAFGRHAASLGTLSYRIGGEEIPAAHTTPFGEELATLLHCAKAAGHGDVVMEVSSHSLAQDRVAGIAYNVAAFTNLTQDHLDFHGDMDSYLAAKARLFEQIVEKEGLPSFGVVNCSDPAWTAFVDAAPVRCFKYGPGGDIAASSTRLGPRGTQFLVDSPWGSGEVSMRLIGLHNVQNALCAISICAGLGVPFDRVIHALATASPAAGRFEHVDAGQPFQVVVDYAHTDDGLRNVLRAARELCDGRVICVFGCGGDRDKTKRPKMGRVAAELADFVIVTSDNPRSEEPERIILDIEQGLQRSGKRKGEDYLAIVDRTAAIQRGIEMANPGDIVLIAGKGHETYQILGTTRIHFDDREVARAALLSLQRT